MVVKHVEFDSMSKKHFSFHRKAIFMISTTPPKSKSPPTVQPRYKFNLLNIQSSLTRHLIKL